MPTACSDLVDADNDHLTPLRKNRKSLQKCKDSHHNQWPCRHSSQKVECRIHCSVCKTDFSCKYAGKNVCQRHVESKTHQQLLKTRKSNMSMTSFVCCKLVNWNGATKIDHPGWGSEVMMCEIITGLNLPITEADVLNKAVKICFWIQILLVKSCFKY